MWVENMDSTLHTFPGRFILKIEIFILGADGISHEIKLAIRFRVLFTKHVMTST